jgi:hypothetical protein
VHHLAAEEAVAYLAEDAQPAPGVARCLQAALLAAVETQEAQKERAAFAAGVTDACHKLTSRRLPERDVENHGFDLHRPADGRIGDRRDARLVLVAQGKMEDEVVRPFDTELAQPAPDCRRRVDLVRRRHQPPTTITASASTSASRGRLATPTAARAGKGSEK